MVLVITVLILVILISATAGAAISTYKKAKVKVYIEELDKKSSFYRDIGSGKYRSFIRRNETIQKIILEVLNENR